MHHSSLSLFLLLIAIALVAGSVVYVCYPGSVSRQLWCTRFTRPWGFVLDYQLSVLFVPWIFFLHSGASQTEVLNFDVTAFHRSLLVHRDSLPFGFVLVRGSKRYLRPHPNL